MPPEREHTYDVVIDGGRFPFPTFRQMADFARELERKGYDVRRCEMRSRGARLAFKGEAWSSPPQHGKRGS